MRKILFSGIILFLSTVAAIKAEAVELGRCVIYHAPDAPPSVKEAAKELRTYIGKVIGVQLEIRTTAASPMIALGNTEHSRAA
ncbi:MAG: hypothetical protein J6S58_11270 [Lentisphaeria bacterium]|nr:hypothetical protein [Lentisphaeria bacterium]